MSDIYERILKKAEDSGLNGKELGAILGLKKSPLTDWKNKKSNPTLEQIIKLCEIFAVTSDYLIFGKDSIDGYCYTEHETEVLVAYRSKPEMQPAVDKLLDIQAENAGYVDLAARGGKYKVKKEDALKVHESTKDIPYEEDHDLI